MIGLGGNTYAHHTGNVRAAQSKGRTAHRSKFKGATAAVALCAQLHEATILRATRWHLCGQCGQDFESATPGLEGPASEAQKWA